MDLIILISIARIIESYRDAKIFNYPTKDRSLTWHILKFFQYGLWLLAGIYVTTWVNLIIALAIAWVIFEVSLKLFRNHWFV